MLLPEANVSRKLAMAKILLQAFLLQNFLRESVNFMIDLRELQYEVWVGGSQLDFSVIAVSIVLALLARRLVEFFLDIGIDFVFSSFGIRIGMAGPVIAIGFGGRKEAGWWKQHPPPDLIDKTLTTSDQAN